MRRALVGALALGLCAAAAPKGQPVSILPGGDSKKPISIEADKLDYFEKEGRAVYDGHVVVVQGDSHLTCARLTIFMDHNAPAAATTPVAADAGAAASATADAAPAGDASSKLKHMDCAGPVKVVSKTQTATGDNGTYDKGRNNVILTGHVVLTDGRNVTKGDRLVYDLNTGQAAVQGGGSRVTGLFLPGVDDAAKPEKKKK
jgi:lipopolysaccharide export system protein LptA